MCVAMSRSRCSAVPSRLRGRAPVRASHTGCRCVRRARAEEAMGAAHAGGLIPAVGLAGHHVRARRCRVFAAATFLPAIDAPSRSRRRLRAGWARGCTSSSRRWRWMTTQRGKAWLTAWRWRCGGTGPQHPRTLPRRRRRRLPWSRRSSCCRAAWVRLRRRRPRQFWHRRRSRRRRQCAGLPHRRAWG